jgi:hypothetical protein
MMREDLRAEIQRKIAESFEAVRQPTRSTLSEEERRERLDEYASLLFKSALRQIERK